MNGSTNRPDKKRLGELLVEAGVVLAEEMPKGLEYAQKASDNDYQSVPRAKQLIDEQGLPVATALRAISLSKQRRCNFDTALAELGWRQRAVVNEPVPTLASSSSSFNAAELDSIGLKPASAESALAPDINSVSCDPASAARTATTFGANAEPTADISAFDLSQLDAIGVKPTTVNVETILEIASVETASIDLASVEMASAATELIVPAEPAFDLSQLDAIEAPQAPVAELEQSKFPSGLSSGIGSLLKGRPAGGERSESGLGFGTFNRPVEPDSATIPTARPFNPEELEALGRLSGNSNSLPTASQFDPSELESIGTKSAPPVVPAGSSLGTAIFKSAEAEAAKKSNKISIGAFAKTKPESEPGQPEPVPHREIHMLGESVLSADELAALSALGVAPSTGEKASSNAAIAASDQYSESVSEQSQSAVDQSAAEQAQMSSAPTPAVQKSSPFGKLSGLTAKIGALFNKQSKQQTPENQPLIADDPPFAEPPDAVRDPWLSRAAALPVETSPQSVEVADLQPVLQQMDLALALEQLAEAKAAEESTLLALGDQKFSPEEAAAEPVIESVVEALPEVAGSMEDWTPTSLSPELSKQLSLEPLRQPEAAKAALPAELSLAIETGDQLMLSANYEPAAMFYAQAMDVLEKDPQADPLHVADILVKAGSAFLHLNDFGKCEVNLCRALNIRQNALGGEDIAVAECLDQLAELYDVQSQFLEAERYYLGALGIKERLLSSTNSEVTRSLKKLVAVSKRRGAQPEEKLYGELLTEAGILDSHRLGEGLNLAQQSAVPIGRALISLNYLNEDDFRAVLQAQLLIREGSLPGYLAVRALRLCSQQQISLEQALREMGMEPDATASGNVFELLRVADELVVAECELDSSHPDIAALCIKLGDLYTDHLRYVQAEILYKRAVASREKELDTHRVEFAEALGRLADLNYRMEQNAQAEQMYLRLLDIWEAESGTEEINFANTLECLASTCYVQGNYKEAGRRYQLAINTKKKLLGVKHPGLVPAIQGRANCYFGDGRYAESEHLYRDALEILDQVYGPDNEQTSAVCSVLGDVVYSQGRLDEAQQWYNRALDSLSNCSNPDVFTFGGILEKLAHCSFERGDLVRADVFYRHFIQTRERSGTAQAPDFVDALERYAVVLDSMERPDLAANIRQCALTTRESINY